MIRKILILVLACFLFQQSLSAGESSVKIDIFKIIQIESSGNPRAFNAGSGARGLCQITEIVLTEWNNFNEKKHKLDDLWMPDVNVKIARWYLEKRIPQMLKHFAILDTVDHRLWAYNAGIGRVKEKIMPDETKDYIMKYHKKGKL